VRSPRADDGYRVLWPVRKGQLWFEELVPRRSRRQGPHLFNLDVHIAVIRDLAREIVAQGADLTQWSISGHNALTHRAFRFPDPVGVVNARTWAELDDRAIDRFQDRYWRFLNQFDGFVATHTPAFAQLFSNTGKPVLVVASTRYEVPYTERPSDWLALNQFLRSGMLDGSLTVVANNRADADYFERFVGVSVDVVPSVCDYQAPSPPRGNGKSVILGRSGPALDAILAAGGDRWTTASRAYGKPYSWEDLAASSEVLAIPYNVSTMTLFELATAGTPVAVPGPRLIKELASIDGQVLSELSFFQVKGLSPKTLESGDPNNFESPLFLNWWLDRSDFYNDELMPNIRVIENLAELGRPNSDRRSESSYWHGIHVRNRALKARRSELISAFLGAL
jgi:hypothetical protein